MLSPKKLKWRKPFRGKQKGFATAGDYLSYGDFGLQALESGWVTAREIEAGRVAIARAIKKGGKMWIRIFPDKPYTKKPTEVRMGKGKGPIEAYVAVIKPGRMLYEMEGVISKEAVEALEMASHKLSVKTRVVKREGVHHE